MISSQLTIPNQTLLTTNTTDQITHRVIEIRTEPGTTAQDITVQDPDPESTPRPRTSSLREKDITQLSKEINTLKANQEQQEKITDDLRQQIRKFTESQEQMAIQISTTSENIQAINRTQSMILEQIQLLHRPTNNNRQHARRASPRPHVRSPVPSELSIPEHFLTESEQQGEDPYEDRDDNSQSEQL
ncbi:hypothetical protein RclHR1_27220003 [Rhizophagus clarus]|uniref:Uncharacterized protein n=1 Tax=Rhizophagus clarus TaxID=94130 RepID=A0A2Z6R1T4_9GLOM|nr:hypothetical protein RclHR1_27220003 [Rhizophagus clarus]